MWRLIIAALAAGAAMHANAAQPYESTYAARAASPTLIRDATILTGTGARLDGGDLLIADGRIVAIGADLAAPDGARIVDARDQWVTPGLIDVHSHLGVYASPGVDAHNDSNEVTGPLTPNVWAEHGVWPQDPGFQAALEGGVTTLHVLPGSANLIGGRSVVIRNVPATTYAQMKFPGAPQGVKMACGENPKRTYGARNQSPGTRMANVAAVRQAFRDAQDYQRQWAKYQRDLAAYEKKGAGKAKQGGDKEDSGPPQPPKFDLGSQTLVGVLEGRIKVHVHCYRADDMATMLDVADELGFRIAAFHHAVEAYKLAEPLARRGVCGALWADWWGFKMEAYDGIQENLPLVDRPAGGCAIVHSDSAEGIQRLNQEAAKSMARGARLGLNIPPERAIRWVTANPAKALGLDDRIGTLEHSDVLIRDGRIAAVAAGLNAAGALVMEAKGRPLTPGLFGGLTAIGLMEVSAESQTNDAGIAFAAPAWQQQWRPELDVTLAFNPRSALIPVNRIEGLTWAMLGPYSDAIVNGQGAGVTLDGRQDAVLDGSRTLFVTWDGGAGGNGGSRAALYMLFEQAIREVRASRSSSEGALLHPAGREALAQFLRGGRVVFHVDRAADISQLIAFATRNGLKPVINSGAEAWMVADELARADVPVVLDPLVNLPSSFDRIGARLDAAVRLRRAGVRIAFSSGDIHNARKIRQLAGNAVAHGLPWDDALAAITASPAEIFGLAQRGRIVVGQTADLVLWSGDPLEVTSIAEQVWIAGRAVEMQSRQTRLRDRYFKGGSDAGR